MIDILSPVSAFISVDFPTFGLPMIFTKPDLNPSGVLINSNITDSVFNEAIDYCVNILRLQPTAGFQQVYIYAS
jgi:hypothetical protein